MAGFSCFFSSWYTFTFTLLLLKVFIALLQQTGTGSKHLVSSLSSSRSNTYNLEAGSLTSPGQQSNGVNLYSVISHGSRMTLESSIEKEDLGTIHEEQTSEERNSSSMHEYESCFNITLVFSKNSPDVVKQGMSNLIT